MNNQSKPWPCPKCRANLGNIVFGELNIDGDFKINTDQGNLVVMCKKCGTYKIWYTTDRMSRMLREIAIEFVKVLHEQGDNALLNLIIETVDRNRNKLT